MEFRVLIFILSLLASCGSHVSDNTVGEEIGDAHSSNIIKNLRPMIQMNNLFYYFDETSDHLQSINISTKKHVASIKIENPDKFINLIPGSKDNYFFKVFDRKIEVVDANAKLKSSIIVRSTPLSYLYDQKTNRLAIISQNYSVTLAQLDSTGSLKESWSGGPLINGSTTITHGDFTETGDIVLVTDSKNLLQVGFESSITEGSWQTQDLEFDQEFTNISWFTIFGQYATIIGDNVESDIGDEVENTNVTTNTKNLYVVDLETNTVKATKNMKEVLSRFLVSSPHLYYIESTPEKKVRSLRIDRNGDIIDIPLPDISKNICYSDIDINQGIANIVLCEKKYRNYSYYKDNEDHDSHDPDNTYMRIRLDDLFTLAEKKIPSESKIAIDNNHLMVTLPYALGYSEIFRFTDQKDFVIKGYNLKNL